MTLCRCELQSLQRKEGPEGLPKVGAYPYGRHQPPWENPPGKTHQKISHQSFPIAIHRSLLGGTHRGERNKVKLGMSWCLRKWPRPFWGCLKSGTGHQLDIGIMTSCVFFSSLLARCLTINGFLARFTWTGGPWWTMQCRIGTHRWSRFVQRNNIGKCRSCHCCSKFYSTLDSVRWRKTSATSLKKKQ